MIKIICYEKYPIIYKVIITSTCFEDTQKTFISLIRFDDQFKKTSKANLFYYL